MAKLLRNKIAPEKIQKKKEQGFKIERSGDTEIKKPKKYEPQRA